MPVPRYFFDVHNVDVLCAAWDDTGRECPDRDEVERQARRIVEDHADKHDGGRAPVSVSVLDDAASIVLTATIDRARTVRVVWK